MFEHFSPNEMEHSGNMQGFHVFSDCHNISIFSWCAHSLGTCGYSRFFLFVISFNPHWWKTQHRLWLRCVHCPDVSRTSRDLNSGFSSYEQTDGCRGGWGWEKDGVGGLGLVDESFYTEWMDNKVLPYRTTVWLNNYIQYPMIYIVNLKVYSNIHELQK